MSTTILQSHCALWFRSAIALESKHLCERESCGKTITRAGCTESADPREFYSRKNDLVFFPPLLELQVLCLSGNPGFPASSELH